MRHNEQYQRPHGDGPRPRGTGGAERVSRRRLASALIGVAASTTALSGCATVDPTEDYDWAQREVASATGEDAFYRPGEEELIAERVDELLADGLTAQESVQICLLNNGEIQSLLFEIGVRKADLVQAGLLSNPLLAGAVRLPLGGGSTTTELRLVQNLIELWHIPPRKRLAQSQLEQTVLEVAHSSARLAAQTKTAYFSATSAAAALAAARRNSDTAGTFLELTRERQAAGAATQVDVNAAHSAALEQQTLVRDALYAEFESKRKLALMLGIAGRPRDLDLLDAVAEVPEWSIELVHLVDIARACRLDLKAAAKNVDATWSALALEKRYLFRNVRAGVSLEGEGGDVQLGPAVVMQVPIFDQNQAQISKAEFRHAQALRRHVALEILVDQQVRGAFEQFTLAVDTARLYEDELLPLRRSSLELARESFAEGKIGFLSVLEAQSRLLRSRREYVDRLEAVAVSVPALEAACGRPLRDLRAGGDPLRE